MPLLHKITWYYPAVVTYENDLFLVTFPDCPGCATYGDTPSHAIAMATEALDGWLETSLKNGDKVSRPSALLRAGQMVAHIPVSDSNREALEKHWNRTQSLPA